MSTLPDGPGYPPIAKPFNIAYRLMNMSAVEFDTYKLQHVTNVEVGTVHPAASGKSASFRITMAGPDLNPGNPDTRRTFVVRITQE